MSPKLRAELLLFVLSLGATNRFVLAQTGRDVSTFVQLIKSGSQPLFQSSIERFYQSVTSSFTSHAKVAVRPRLIGLLCACG